MKATRENSSLDEFFKAVLKLKTTGRQGWKDKLAMRNPESVADHCYAVTVIAMVLSDRKKLDTQRIIRMSLLHDLAESITGDLTPDMVSKSKKTKLENTAMRKILQNLDESLQKEYWDIWQEYQKGKTAEAVFLHQIDKLEMTLQAREYRKQGYSNKQISQFFKSAAGEITDEGIAKLIPNV